MAQPAGTQIQPDFSATSKRSREVLDGDSEESTSKRQNKAQDVMFRIVVPSRQIGKVIGKEGCRIQKIREETKATVKIADAVSRHEERVIIISSKACDDADPVSDAEHALQQIAALILKENESTEEASQSVVGVGSGHVAANTIRLLIAGSQAGSLIGMSGQNIAKLRNSTGATISVLAPNQLPLCASSLESDRVVQISGDVPVVLKALEEICCELRTTNLAADYVSLDLMVPEELVGGLIGRGGSNISRVRNESGAMIKVFGGKGEQTHRHLQLTGGAQQVALAKQIVDDFLNTQQVQQAGAQQSYFQP